ncbi:uncharacterized protein N7473_008156 [Penicillium subrubescens]|uniref:uncharacterized protein n=1 Tax=Penicillium subrubescens TaxID=1316194 RepID=UPI00254560C9|nr:uncharacterized protein N7473_008156 [Penicillium subrubescens]KAJ5891928.1 hypothetical protein N7473_008156 [Penicillium subrubescens]
MGTLEDIHQQVWTSEVRLSPYNRNNNIYLFGSLKPENGSLIRNGRTHALSSDGNGTQLGETQGLETDGNMSDE